MSYLQSSIYLSVSTNEAFDIFTDELQTSFLKNNIEIELKENGLIKNEEGILGKITTYSQGSLIAIEWDSLNIQTEEKLELTITFEKHNDGTIILFKPKNLISYFYNNDTNLIGWYVDQAMVPIIKNLTPTSFGDWVTDRTVRKPTGLFSRKIYSDPLYHWPNFYEILDQMKLTSNDYVLEIGCGGGVLLRECLKTGCKAVGIDHSPDMVKLARESNDESIKNGKLEVLYSEADNIPLKDQMFTHVVMTGVFQFIKNPDTVLNEIIRLLKSNGKLFIFCTSKELKGTPAAPEPFASRLTFYEDFELDELARKTGFTKSKVLHPNLRDYAIKVGIPKEGLSLFSATSSLFLVAEK